jgi:hypothetical protein
MLGTELREISKLDARLDAFCSVECFVCWESVGSVIRDAHLIEYLLFKSDI